METPPPLVTDAWVVDESSKSEAPQYALPPPRRAEPPPQKKFLPQLGRKEVTLPQMHTIGIGSSEPHNFMGASKSTALLSGLTRRPTILDQCPHCGQQTQTKTRTYPNAITALAVVVILLVFWPLCWIPLVLDKCKETCHKCSKCKEKVGTVKPLEDMCERRRE